MIPRIKKPSNGVFRRLGRYKVEPFYKWYSLNYRWKKRHWLDKGEKVPEWFSECYVLGSFGLALILLVVLLILRGVSWYWFVVPIGWIAYKLFEIILFFVHWIFLATTPLYSYKRSLIGIFFNLLEITIYFTIAFVYFGCFDFGDALYNSGINILTVSITNTDCASALCKSLMILELLVADFLVLIILASLVGQLRRKEGYK